MHLVLEPVNNRRLADLCGPNDEYIHQLEEHFHVEIRRRSNQFDIIGQEQYASAAKEALVQLYEDTDKKIPLNPTHVFQLIKEMTPTMKSVPNNKERNELTIHTQKETIRPKGLHQEQFVKSIREFDISFGIGPAGTGKTYLAVACALEALQKQQVQRLVFVRPAVEAGENLGFLPGDLEEKITPYLRPIYDAVFEMVGYDNAVKLIENNVIELAPLAYMRGRTLNDSFIILDEAQNTTIEQMKMFLTRIGFGSTAVITGDVTQVDLGRGIKSGLTHSMDILKHIDKISFTMFNSKDAVRHPLVQAIIEAYGQDET